MNPGEIHETHETIKIGLDGNIIKSIRTLVSMTNHTNMTIEFNLSEISIKSQVKLRL